MIRHLNKREKLLLMIAATALSAVLFSAIIIRPITGKWAALSDKIHNEELTLLKYLKMIKQEDTINRNFEKFSSYTGFSGSEQETASLTLRETEKIAKDSNITITDIKSLPIRDLKTHKLLIVEVELDASMQNITRFIYNLMNSQNAFCVEKLNLTRGQDNSMRCYFQISKILTQ